jgi:hypothetical protein
MRVVCERTQEADQLPRWLAEGYYQVATGVPAWASHPNFPKPESADYYAACLERLADLADWFFRGWHAYEVARTPEPVRHKAAQAKDQLTSTATTVADKLQDKTPQPVREKTYLAADAVARNRAMVLAGAIGALLVFLSVRRSRK